MPDQTNIAVILCDQLRRGALSCAGDPNVSTPNLDDLAANGVRFSRSYSTYPICVPTRYSFMTGNYAHSRSVPGIDWRVPPTERTIADEFNDAGYQTAYVGKWHLSGHHPYRYSGRIDQSERTRRLNRTPVPPELQGGFEYWRGFELRNNHFDTAFYVDDDPTPHLIDGHQTDGVVNLGIEFLDQHDDTQPFFLVTSIEAPHPPFQVPEQYYERWRHRDINLPPNFDDRDELDGGRGPRTETILDDHRVYYAMIEQLDDAVGRFLQALDERGLREQTAVVFLSDHGELLGCHGRIGKKDPYEESAGVPFIVSHPDGNIDDGRVFNTPTSTEDWYPTLLGLAGLEPQDTKPGTDLTPLARGEQRSLNRNGVLLEFVREDRPDSGYAEETWRGFCTERYKYTVKVHRGDGHDRM
ncbi:sulfatase family protein [Haladaptatus sp. NG-SE-30]